MLFEHQQIASGAVVESFAEIVYGFHLHLVVKNVIRPAPGDDLVDITLDGVFGAYDVKIVFGDHRSIFPGLSRVIDIVCARFSWQQRHNDG